MWEDHTHDLKLLIGKETSYANYQKYCTALKWMKQFRMEEYRVHDVPIKLINRQMVVKFEVFLRTKKLRNYYCPRDMILKIALKNRLKSMLCSELESVNIFVMGVCFFIDLEG